MVQAARDALSGPDGIWYLIDPKTELKHEEVVLELLQEVLKKKNRPWLYLVFTKKDWIDSKKLDISKLEAELTGRIKELFPDLDVTRYEISALEKDGTEALLAATYERLPLNPPFFTDEDQASDRPVRFFVEELIREQLFQKLRDELPYGCRVEIEHYKEEPKPIRIDAKIWVERESQKRMVIGAGASLIKKIGIGARKEIEDFLGEKIFLGLHVKVDKDWTFKP
jgi:GTP-binding protein Era